MIKNIFLGLFAIGLFVSCNTEVPNIPVQISMCDQYTVVDGNLYSSATTNGVTINSISISGNCMKVNYSSSGCDGSTWTVKLIHDGNLDNSNSVPTRKLKFVLENTELCTTIVTREKTFDISNLKANGVNVVNLKFINGNQTITYNY